MTRTGQLIEHLLETTSWDHRYSYEKVASEIEQRFLANTIMEAVEFLGGKAEVDAKGQLIVYTNVYPAGRPRDEEEGHAPVEHTTE